MPNFPFKLTCGVDEAGSGLRHDERVRIRLPARQHEAVRRGAGAEAREEAVLGEKA